MIQCIDHLGIAVKDLETAVQLYSGIFSVDPTVMHREVVEEQKVSIASFLVGDMRVELTAATSPESPIAKFIEKRGEGIHHVAFRVNGINQQLQTLQTNGIQLINSEATKGAHEMMIAFLHPKSTGGVLMELCEHQSEIPPAE